MRRTQEGYSPFKNDKPKDAKNSPFDASSMLVVKAIYDFERRDLMEDKRRTRKPEISERRENTVSEYNKKKTAKKKGKVRRTMFITFIIILGLFTCASAVFLGLLCGNGEIEAKRLCESFQLKGDYDIKLSSTVYYFDEEENDYLKADNLHSEQNRIWVDLEKTPKYLKEAFIAIEDERFDSHQGVDWKRTSGAIFTYLFKGDSSYGGSTITQQLIKNVTGNNKHSPLRKMEEIFIALNLEKMMTKDEIIEMYMNIIYLGQGCHGVQSASNVYFSKDVSELTLAECASIAGITQYPSKYDPILNFEEHKIKQELVLDKMCERGYITEQECENAKAEELVLVKGTSKTQKTEIQSYFIDQVVEDVINDLVVRKGYTEDEATKILFTKGLKIYSTMDPKVQNTLEEVYKDGSNFPGVSGANGPQSAMIVIDPHTGHIKGIVGGRGEKVGNRVLNRATQTVRQPGSSIKPLSVYAPAIEYGIITPATMVDDSELKIGDWNVRNSDNKYMGKITSRVALEKSRNIPVVRILDKLSVEKSFDFLTDNLGFTSLVSNEKRADGQVYSDKYYSCLGLGGLTDGISVRELAAAYCTFANQGIYNKSVTYTKIVDASGNVLLENKQGTKRAMSKETAYSVANMMTGVITSGTGTAARLANPEIMAGGKTGTTTNDIDRWFAGFTPNYVGVVWFGYDAPKNMSGLGNPCIRIWKKVMDKIHEGEEIGEIEMPSTMVSKRICQISGKIATSKCNNTRIDYFKSGMQPSSYCSSHEITEPEDEIDDKIENEDTGLGGIKPGSGIVNPPAEGDIITHPNVTKEPLDEPIAPVTPSTSPPSTEPITPTVPEQSTTDDIIWYE